MKKSPRQVREAWLMKVANAMKPKFRKAGYTLPPFRVSCGFTSTGRRGRRIGECWTDKASRDQHHEIFLCPTRDETLDVIAILAHELCHAAVGIAAKHGPLFKKAALAMGLEGPMRSTTAGPEFKEFAKGLMKRFGKYPHAELLAKSAISSGGPKQKTYLLKACCPDCGYTVRITQKWAEVGMPTCPADGVELELS